MNYEELWNALKEHIRYKSNKPMTSSDNYVKTAEDMGRRSAYCEILATMAQYEYNDMTKEKNKNDKYAL